MFSYKKNRRNPFEQKFKTITNDWILYQNYHKNQKWLLTSGDFGWPPGDFGWPPSDFGWPPDDFGWPPGDFGWPQFGSIRVTSAYFRVIIYENKAKKWKFFGMIIWLEPFSHISHSTDGFNKIFVPNFGECHYVMLDSQICCPKYSIL